MANSLGEYVVWRNHEEVVEVEGTKYKLKSAIQFDCLDWKGACAGIYIANSLNPKETIKFGPALEEGDVQEAANEIILSLSTRYHKLRTAHQLKDPERAELQKLEKYLQAA